MAPRQAFVIPDGLQTLYHALSPVSGKLMRWSLRYLGLNAPEEATVASSAKRVVRYVAEGQLTEAQAWSLATEGREYSSKRVYLYRTNPRKLAGWSPDPVDASAVVTSMPEMRLRQSGGLEVLNYILLDGARIRISYSEAHTILRRIQGTGLIPELVPELRQKTIVVEADRDTGDVTLMLDKAGAFNGHGRRSLDYYAYWQARAASIFGVGALDPLPLLRAMRQIEREDLVRIGLSMVRTADGRITFLPDGMATDVRHMPHFPSINAGRVSYDEDEYYWLPQPSVPAGSVGVPLREVKTNIYGVTGEVRFMQDATAAEVQYVLTQLRLRA